MKDASAPKELFKLAEHAVLDPFCHYYCYNDLMPDGVATEVPVSETTIASSISSESSPNANEVASPAKTHDEESTIKEQTLSVFVSSDALPLGPLPFDEAGPEDVLVPGGAVQGEAVVSWNDPTIPDILYHATTNLPAIQADGILRASNAGGLGAGSEHATPHVSVTTERKTAEQILSDLRLAAEVGAAPSSQVIDTLLRAAYRESEDFGRQFEEYLGPREKWSRWNDGVRETYDSDDWLNSYLSFRQRSIGIADSIWWGKSTQLDPTKIGVVEIPKTSLNNGALIVSFDRSQPNSLYEIRSYGDVRLKPLASKAL